MKMTKTLATMTLALSSMGLLWSGQMASADEYSDYSYSYTSSDSSNLYPVGQCTWGVKSVATWASNSWGNGGDWAANAAADGYSVGTTPVVGSIICWTDGGYGHVAYVTDVSADGQIQVLESNYAGNMTLANYRGWFDPNNSVTAGTVSYIYPNS
ncbi:surface antigen [Streptococcus loxodontisalivarius]|uniref:Surface antigen n=1 Tax=Streptococcus loxodontisalivarius TaxID=1349415 RepID=A0ABS2PSB7_9STRE|nr:surface antigen [Streptococcus loxodontisalivarius]